MIVYKLYTYIGKWLKFWTDHDFIARTRLNTCPWQILLSEFLDEIQGCLNFVENSSQRFVWKCRLVLCHEYVLLTLAHWRCRFEISHNIGDHGQFEIWKYISFYWKVTYGDTISRPCLCKAHGMIWWPCHTAYTLIKL